MITEDYKIDCILILDKYIKKHISRYGSKVYRIIGDEVEDLSSELKIQVLRAIADTPDILNIEKYIGKIAARHTKLYLGKYIEKEKNEKNFKIEWENKLNIERDTKKFDLLLYFENIDYRIADYIRISKKCLSYRENSILYARLSKMPDNYICKTFKIEKGTLENIVRDAFNKFRIELNKEKE